MSYTAHDDRDRDHPRRRHDSYYSSSRDTDAYPRRDKTLAAMKSSARPASYASSSPYEPRPPPPYRPHPRKQQTWPPSPSVEDETASLTREVHPPTPTSAPEGEPPGATRGTVDQETLLEDIGSPDDRRFVLVSDSRDDDHVSPQAPSSSIRDRRRKSVAERGNMAPIDTAIERVDPPVFTARVSTPYAFTRPHKDSTAPTPRADFLSPELMTPRSAGIPPSAPQPASRGEVFEDSDLETEHTARLHASERKPARYSFVKSDLQKEDLRTHLYDPQPRPEARRRESAQHLPPSFRKGDSSGSSKGSSYPESPRSSSSSLHGGSNKSGPYPVESGYPSNSRTPSRPSSPSEYVPTPRLPPRIRESPPISRPSSRGNTRPASPLSFPSTVRPPSPGPPTITDTDWHSTYPPVTAQDRSRQPSRVGRHETMPVLHPRIDVQSPSPARAPATTLPYPVDDRPLDVFMPSESHYQFDHSTVASSRQAFPDSPGFAASSTPGSPRLTDIAHRAARNKITAPDDQSCARRTRSNSVRSQVDTDDRREARGRRPTNMGIDRPLPSCPRDLPTKQYDDWYSLKGYRNFDICPSCYSGVFADTPFAAHFSQLRLGERPTERFCDFSSPWIRLAWLLTIKQRRPSLELLYALADIVDIDRPCPDARELSSDRVTWYGIADQRDGVHVANFSICSCDKRMIETLFQTMRGYFTKLPSTYTANAPAKYMCSLRTSSRRFPKYLDLLVELDAEAQDLDKRPKIDRFIQMAREHAFKGECGKDKSFVRKAWHFVPSLPELTVCEECYDELIWPALQSKSTSSSIPRLFNKSIQLVPTEDYDFGSSCCLYSPRMRKVFSTSIKEDDFTYLKRKAVDRRRAEIRLAREKKSIMNWMVGLDRSGSQWERAKSELKALEKEWTTHWE
ncbi:hypothetical protein BKA63DRAFT_511502 [Paraphoma chrysanthemicola]|nr:hypothetical protein BKA63DRAFT_511502 [Paraphoma chrysanthemicola]